MYLQILGWYSPPPFSTTVERGKLSFCLLLHGKGPFLFTFIWSLYLLESQLHACFFYWECCSGRTSVLVFVPHVQCSLQKRNLASPAFRKTQSRSHLWCWIIIQGSFFHIVLGIHRFLHFMAIQHFFFKFYSLILAVSISGCLSWLADGIRTICILLFSTRSFSPSNNIFKYLSSLKTRLILDSLS